MYKRQVISGYRQFDYAYNALKYDVADYLLKPIDAIELNSALKKISEDLRACLLYTSPGGT